MHLNVNKKIFLRFKIPSNENDFQDFGSVGNIFIKILHWFISTTDKIVSNKIFIVASTNVVKKCVSTCSLRFQTQNYCPKLFKR